MLAHMLMTLSMSGQPCDLTFMKRKPLIDVVIHDRLALAMMYGAGPKKMLELFNDIRLKSGESVSISETWSIFPMPKNGFTQAELDAVDMAGGEQVAGPKGETVRQMIKNVYHCTSPEEEEKYLRRYLAS